MPHAIKTQIYINFSYTDYTDFMIVDMNKKGQISKKKKNDQEHINKNKKNVNQVISKKD